MVSRTSRGVGGSASPGGLYQQNTLRDALVAGITFNIFHKHADRVRMANIAQMINVLQAMILTDKDRMIVTPTYHVFEMYKVHQDATAIPIQLASPRYRRDDLDVPALSASASRDANGTLHVSLVNLDPHRGAKIAVRIAGDRITNAAGRVLTASAMDAHNTFDKPHAVETTAFSGFTLKRGELALELPAKSVVVLSLQ